MKIKEIARDVSFALRSLRRNPGYSITVFLTLGLGLGVCTAIFSMVDSLLLRPLPFPHPEQLVHVWRTDEGQGWDQLYVSAPDLEEIQAHLKGAQDVGGFANRQFSLSGLGGHAVQITGARVTANLFPTLGVEAAMGRVVNEEDVRRGNRVVVISHDLWQRRFGSGPEILGAKILLQSEPYTVVGVMPADFAFPMLTTEIWAPSVLEAAESTRDNSLYQVVARLNADTGIGKLEDELEVLTLSLAERFPELHCNTGFDVIPLREALLFDHDRVERVSWLLAGAVAFAFLLVCSNVANLMLVRLVARAREVAVRKALGASQGRLCGLFLTETVVLSLLGASVGLLLTTWIVRASTALVPEDLYRVGTFGLNLSTVGFALGMALLTAVFVGALPLLQAIRGRLLEDLGAGRAGVGGRRANRRFAVLVVTQLAVGTVLLVGALLMIRTVQNLRDIDPGFDSQVLALKMNLPDTKYATKAERSRFIDSAIARVERVPGVASSAAINFLPLNNETLWRPILVEGRELPRGEDAAAIFLYASEGYFETAGVPVLRGRSIAPTDAESSPPVAVVNRAFERRYSVAGDIVGQRVAVAKQGEAPSWRTIVGVVADYHHVELKGAVQPQIFVPLAQRPWTYLRLLARAEGDPLSLVPSIQQEMGQLDPDVPVGEPRTLGDVMRESLATERFVSASLVGLGLGALLVVAVGLYGMMAFRVVHSIPEIGLRMALGAERKGVLKMIMLQAARLTLLGLSLGVIGAAAASLALSRFLYQVEPLDPVTYLVIVLVLGAVGLIAGFVPARRASRIDPMEALYQQ